MFEFIRASVSEQRRAGIVSTELDARGVARLRENRRSREQLAYASGGEAVADRSGAGSRDRTELEVGASPTRAP
ncbi:MAG: hypothetical protein FJ294_04705 [Planctomycetes bacterium]|nr:hypothetical protein [Planctomycetota bacterium]